jgi:hypothetical protein
MKESIEMLELAAQCGDEKGIVAALGTLVPEFTPQKPASVDTEQHDTHIVSPKGNQPAESRSRPSITVTRHRPPATDHA